MIRKLLPALVAGAVLLLAACGDDDEQSSSASNGGNGTDRAFVAAMIPHHESAIEMAEVAQKRGESAFVKNLANDIVRTQKAEISALRREDEALETAGVEPGSLGMGHDAMGADADTHMLDTADPFDPSFLEMMVPHHEGAVAMAKAELEQGKDPELREIARDIISAQEREIREMREQLEP